MFPPPPHSVPAGAADPLAPPAANETFPALHVSRFHREALAPLQSNATWPPPRRDSLQSPATFASSTTRHIGPRFAPSPFPPPSSHWRGARQSKPAPHTCSPRRGAGPIRQFPSLPESVPRATYSGLAPPAKPTHRPRSPAHRAVNRAAASTPAAPAPPPASATDRTEHAPAAWLPRKAPA